MQQPPDSVNSPSWPRTIRAVAWAMLGLRNSNESRRDQQALRPLQVIAIGLLGLVLFVSLLMGVVSWVV